MKLFIQITILILSSVAWANDGVYLDPPYPESRPPIVMTEDTAILFEGLNNFDSHLFNFRSFNRAVDHLVTAVAQTEVKSQGRRGTCSIFSSTAILEYQLKHLGLVDEDLDLSEQWLEYITAGQRGKEGSWSYYNFDQYGRYGFLEELVWVYNPSSWHPYKESFWDFSATQEEKEIFTQHCAELEGDQKLFDGCLIGQLNPLLLTMDEQTLVERDMRFYNWRTTAESALQDLNIDIHSQWVGSNTKIQQALDKGEVVALDVSFFYEAWNHRKATSLGLKRDVEMWSEGVVSFPHPNSLDYVKSQESDVRAGHSVVLVGYDKEIEITREVLDKESNPMTVTSKGVYYFKNSWGQESFGKDFVLKGTNLPGFGMISMEYAHKHGTFYKMNIIQK